MKPTRLSQLSPSNSRKDNMGRSKAVLAFLFILVWISHRYTDPGESSKIVTNDSSTHTFAVQPPELKQEKKLTARRTVFLIPGKENRCDYRYDYMCKFWFYIRCYVLGSFANVRVLSRGPRGVTEFITHARDGDIVALVWRSKNHSMPPELLYPLLHWRRTSHFREHLPRVRIGVFHIANENDRANWGWYTLPDFIVRNYWIPDMPPHATFVPLGHQLPNRCKPWSTRTGEAFQQTGDVCLCSGIEFKLASMRTYVWNFSGSLRRRRSELLRRLRQSHTLGGKGFVQVSKKFGGDGSFGSETKNPKESYLDSIFESQFVFAPCGNAMETHRIYEAIALGAIPVIENCDPSVADFFPFKETMIDGGPSEMVSFVERFIGKPNEVDALQARVQAWWRRYEGSIATNVSKTMTNHIPQAWKTAP